MDMELSDQIMSLLVTVVALVIVVPMCADMYFNSMSVAVPRDAVALLLFAVVRWFVARGTRTPSTPDTTED